MRHPRYCLTHHPGISSNITNATHFSTPDTPVMLTTLAHRPLYPRWCTNHATYTGTSPQHAAYITYASTSLTLARHPRSTRPTQTHHPRQHASHASTPPISIAHQHKQHAISQTPGYPVKLFELLGLRFQDKMQQFLLLIFIFTAFTFQAYIFIEVWKTAIEKLNFFRGNQSALFKRRLFFQKQMRNFFRKY